MIKVKKKYGFDPDYAIPPGITLKEVMKSLDMSQKELALRTRLTVQSLNRIFKGKQPISYETANRLELVTGVSAKMWNNLEALYREQLAKIQQRSQLQKDLAWLKSMPTLEMIKRNVIEPDKDKVTLLKNTLKFFGVGSVAAWNDIWQSPAIAARRSRCFETRPGPASVWIRLGELEAQKIQCKAYNRERFQKAVENIRTLTVKRPKNFLPEMTKYCSDSGVALALVPEMKKVPWSGATKWLSPNKAMIILSLRHKAEDQFWFSFFHEAGHVLHDPKKDLYINDGTKDDPREQKADIYAAQILIPKGYNFQISKLRSKTDVVLLAKQLDVSAGIVVGRYHHLTKKWQFFKALIRKFDWAANQE